MANPRKRLVWPPILERAAEIVEGYDTPVTLRQVFYRLISAGLIPNDESAYQVLGKKTAHARRRGEFPDLVDNTRSVEQELCFAGPEHALATLTEWYRLDRTVGQPKKVLFVLEKNTLVAQVRDWFDERGLPVAALRGYASTPLVAQIDRLLPDVILYVGDFDPSGEDIVRVLQKRIPLRRRSACCSQPRTGRGVRAPREPREKEEPTVQRVRGSSREARPG